MGKRGTVVGFLPRSRAGEGGVFSILRLALTLTAEDEALLRLESERCWVFFLEALQKLAERGGGGRDLRANLKMKKRGIRLQAPTTRLLLPLHQQVDSLAARVDSGALRAHRLQLEVELGQHLRQSAVVAGISGEKLIESASRETRLFGRDSITLSARPCESRWTCDVVR